MSIPTELVLLPTDALRELALSGDAKALAVLIAKAEMTVLLECTQANRRIIESMCAEIQAHRLQAVQ